MPIEIKMHTLGIAQTNTYLVGDTETSDAVLIDPVDNAPLLLETAEKAGWTIRLILATHGHFDHVLASKELKELTGAPFYIHEADMSFLLNLPQTGLRFTSQLFPEAAVPDRYLTSEPETITVSGIHLETRFTPGHAPGHIAFYMPLEKILFSGDALFAGSIGRTDLPGSNYDTLMRSITEKLMVLEDDVQVYPGHMQATTIGRERRTNPYVADWLTR